MTKAKGGSFGDDPPALRWNKQCHFTRPLTKRFLLHRRSTQTSCKPIRSCQALWARAWAVNPQRMDSDLSILKALLYRYSSAPEDRQGDQGSGGEGKQAHGWAADETEASQSFSQIMGFLNKGRRGRKESQAFTLPNTWLISQSFAGCGGGGQERDVILHSASGAPSDLLSTEAKGSWRGRGDSQSTQKNTHLAIFSHVTAIYIKTPFSSIKTCFPFGLTS